METFMDVEENDNPLFDVKNNLEEEEEDNKIEFKRADSTLNL
jgi:hypothetical protein